MISALRQGKPLLEDDICLDFKNHKFSIGRSLTSIRSNARRGVAGGYQDIAVRHRSSPRD